MDISKAFDKVPRLILMKKLIKIGVGRCMLHALKQLYKLTNCIVKLNGNLSGIFQMKSGIRQGAASSVLLFNLFIDDLFEFLSECCSRETLLDDIHALIHADDTIILSTDRASFMFKCNKAMEFFHLNKLALNKGKCKYIVINPQATDTLCTLHLEHGPLKYTSELKYLGIYITAAGVISKDVKYYIDTVRSTATIKFTNFCSLYRNAPLHVKLDILNTCVVPALLYASETWGSRFHEIEPIYRDALRTALGIRPTFNNNITYIESGMYPLECRIKSYQHKFWSNTMTYTNDHPDSALAKVMSKSDNLHYTNYYKDLVSTYSNHKYCEMSCESVFRTEWHTSIHLESANDPDSRAGYYLRVNPELKSYVPRPQTIMECERILTTRFRTGSHSLAIELGRMNGVSRENRLCKCNSNVQTVWHIFNDCPLTRHVTGKIYSNISEVLNDAIFPKSILKIASILKFTI